MPIRQHTDSGAGIITLDEGGNSNRLNPALLEGIQSALNAHIEDDSVRFIILRSSASVFSTGMDLNAFVSTKEAKDEFRKSVSAYAALLLNIHQSPKTVVGLIEGPVKAGGVGLAAACDVVIAAEDADFELTELYLGLIPANVMPYLLSTRMSAKRAAYLALTAACINAQTAMHWGLVDEVHPADKMEKALKQLGRRLMRISPEASARQKSFMQKLSLAPAGQKGALAIEELLDIASAPKLLDAVAGFTEGELPPWFLNFRPEEAISGLTGERK